LGERHRVHLLRALCQGEPPLSPGGWGEGVDGVRGRGRGRGRDRGRAGSGSDMSQFWDGGGGDFLFFIFVANEIWSCEKVGNLQHEAGCMSLSLWWVCKKIIFCFLTLIKLGI
jgi:hypothetical protein